MYHSGINTVKKSRNKNLKDSLEVLLRIIIGKLSNDSLLSIISKICSWILETNVSEKYIWELGKIVEHAAYHYETNLLEETFTKDVLHIFMQMIYSSDPLINLLGNRIFQHLIDRNKNKTYFESPEIFFQDVKYNVKCNKNHYQRDVEFLRQHRELIHDTLVESVMKHSSKKLNLESTYCTICLLVVEIPFGFTAAAVVCLVMNIQKLALENLAINREVSYHIHATVMAVLSLICWIHDAKIFYAYVNKIMMKRAQWAPQLNPPLKTHYIFAVHYIRWNKPELFFINWEVRFGLWKCFRSIDKNTNNNNINVRVNKFSP
ncbi:uncharacterized protein [Chelonus insularis]|uniref:uncharacterized protein n=1 Tax=Chelonus insularis TaxID=460826 RepID=UPI00158DD657|nr:uncharacterized protein LOC118074251 [Chelonus insularis]